MYTAENFLADYGSTPTREVICPIFSDSKYCLEEAQGTPLEGVYLSGEVYATKRGMTQRVSVAHRRLSDVGELAPFLQRNIASWVDTDPGWKPEHVTEAALSRDITSPRNSLRHDFVIFDKDQRLAGVAKLTRDYINKRTYQIGYSIGVDHQKEGIASKAVRLLLSFAAQELGARWVEAFTIPKNIGSKKVLEHNQFLDYGLVYSRQLELSLHHYSRAL